MSNKNLKKQIIITSLLCLVPYIYGLLLYSSLPQKIPTHWNYSGEVDGYMSKFTVVIIFPFVAMLFNLFLHFMLNVDPKNIGKSNMIINISKWTPAILINIMLPISLLVARGIKVDVPLTVNLFLGILYIFIGNYLPKCEQSYTVGIKLPWTLHSKENWRRTHRFGGYIFIIMGILTISLTIFKIKFGAFLPIPTIIIIVFYSYYLHKKEI